MWGFRRAHTDSFVSYSLFRPSGDLLDLGFLVSTPRPPSCLSQPPLPQELPRNLPSEQFAALICYPKREGHHEPNRGALALSQPDLIASVISAT